MNKLFGLDQKKYSKQIIVKFLIVQKTCKNGLKIIKNVFDFDK